MPRSLPPEMEPFKFKKKYQWDEPCDQLLALKVPKSMKKSLQQLKGWQELARQAIAQILGKEREQPELEEKKVIPLYACPVSAGTPQPTEDYLEGEIDITNYLINDQSNIFSVRASGDSMIGAGINNNDILIVDRSVEPTDGKIIVAILNGELLVKRFELKDDKVYLVAENHHYSSLEVTEEMDFDIWGVVTNVIHSV